MKTLLVFAQLVLLISLVWTDENIQKEHESQIFADFIEAEFDFTDLFKTLTDKLQQIATNAYGVDLFMQAIEDTVEKGEDLVTIPEEIDPEERNVTVEDAISKIEDFVEIQKAIAQDFLTEIEDLLVDVENSTGNFTVIEEHLVTITEIIQGYADANDDIRQYKETEDIEEVYTYLYGEPDTDDWASSDPIDENNTDEMRQNPIIPYGKDAFHEDKDARVFTIKIIGNSSNGFNIVYICIAVPVVLLFVAVATFSLWYNISSKRRRIGSPSLSLAEETKKRPIAVVTIDVDPNKTNNASAPPQKELPSYLEVVSDGIQV